MKKNLSILEAAAAVLAVTLMSLNLAQAPATNTTESTGQLGNNAAGAEPG